MKIKTLSQKDFDELSQINRIEYLIRKEHVFKNIKSSFPKFELFSILGIFLYFRLYNLLIISAYGLKDTYQVINFLSLFSMTLIVILFVSFIGRIIIYFSKTKQISILNEEFYDKSNLKPIKKRK